MTFGGVGAVAYAGGGIGRARCGRVVNESIEELEELEETGGEAESEVEESFWSAVRL